jgi:putative ABC transport system ATP-binding protein
MSSRPVIVSIRDLKKRHGEGDRAVWALQGISFDVLEREFVTLSGPSGSGKSTLLNLIAGLDTPTEGEVMVEGASVAHLSRRERSVLRRRTLAFVFQFFNLLPSLTGRENVAIPLRADRRSRADVAARVERALSAVGIAHRADHYPSEMSGGEMQRIAIARALATDARVILADEPTGNLDSVHGEEILELLKHASEHEGRSVILVTHDLRSAAYGDRHIVLRDGRIVDIVTSVQATTVDETSTRH